MVDLNAWKPIGGKLALMGLPILAKIIDGELNRIPIVGSLIDAEHIERIGRMAIAKVLGVEATPEAIDNAMESQPTSEVQAKLNGLQENLTARYDALKDIFKSEDETSVAMAQISSTAYMDRARAEAGSNNPIATLYRTIALWGTTGAFLYLVTLVLYAVTFGGDILDHVVKAETLVYSMFAAFVGILFGHFLTRAQERKALLAPPPATPMVINPTATVVPVAKKK